MKQLSIDGTPYTIVDPSRVNIQPRQYREAMRPSQPSEARLNTKTWKLSGPIGNSRQQAFGDPLGPDYTINLDGRNDGLLTSAAKRTAVALTAITGVECEVPTSDVSKTNWAEGAGDGDGSAFDELDNGGLSVSCTGTLDDGTYWTSSTDNAEIILGFPAPAGTIVTADNIYDAIWIRTRHADLAITYTLTVYESAAILYQSAGKTSSAAVNVFGTRGWSVPSSIFNGVTLSNVRIGIKRESGTAGALDISEMQILYFLGVGGDVISIDEDRAQLFAQRGSHSTQINPPDMTEAQDVDHGSPITDSVPSWLGNGFVALGTADVVQKRTAVVAATSATYANVTSVNANKLTVGPDRIWMSDATAGTVKSAVADLTSANLSNGINVADTNSGEITGLYTLGELMIAGTTRGPRSFTDAGAPAVLGEAVKDFPSSLNGAAGGSLWGWHYHATKLGLYAISPDGRVENPVGPGEGTEGLRFEGPIDGYPIAVKPFKDSLWVSYLTPDGDSWLLRGVFNARTTPGSGRPDWYVFRKLTGVTCSAIGATTGRTVPAIVWGEDENLAYSDLAFRGREIADTTNYVYGTDGGTWFGTTLVLPVGLVGFIRWAKFFTDNCDATNSWQLSFQADDDQDYPNMGLAVFTDGLQTRRPVTTQGLPNTAQADFRTLKPRLVQTAASTTAPPQIRGDLTIAFDERPEHVREIECVIEGGGSKLATLQALADAGQKPPSAMRFPYDTDVNIDKFGYVMEAEAEDLRDSDDQGIRLKIIEWVVA